MVDEAPGAAAVSTVRLSHQALVLGGGGGGGGVGEFRV